MATGGLYGNSQSTILSYFTWFIFQQAGSQPSTPTGGSYNFLTNTSTLPTGWANTPAIPTTNVWMSMAIVSSQNPVISWSTPTPWASVAGTFTWPSSGIVSSTGATWGTSYTTSGTDSVLALATNPTINNPNLISPTLGATITGSQNYGAISYGTLSYTDVDHLATFAQNVNNYTQLTVQNTNSGSTASSDIVVANNNSTASTYYGNFGMNSSGFTGTGAFNQPNYVYLTSTSGDLAIGTTTSNAIHFLVNSGATDAMTISSTGVVSLGTALPVGSGGTGSTTASGALVSLGSITSTTGSLITPAGTTAQRDGSPQVGYFRWNTTLTQAEVWNGTAWTGVGGGVNQLTQSGGVTVLTGTGQVLVGPITVPTGQTITVQTGARLVIL